MLKSIVVAECQENSYHMHSLRYVKTSHSSPRRFATFPTRM